MKKCRIGILLSVVALILLCCTGCFRNRDKNKGETTTNDTSSLIPAPGVTLPGEDGETTPHMSDTTRDTTSGTSESHAASETTQQATTTKKAETTTKVTESATTTKKQEMTTKAPETTTKKPETTTKKPETTTTVTATTTVKPETTTQKPATTTERTETTTTARQTDEFPLPDITTIPDPIIPAPNESSTTTPGGDAATTTTESNGTTTAPNGNGQTTAPEIGAGEWLHFEDFRDSHAGAAAYLGQSAAEMPITEIIEYFGLPLTAQDITLIEHGNGEANESDSWYLILPRYRDTVVRIREAEQNGRRRTRAGELIAEGMHPMLIRCDADETEIFVELIHGDQTVSFALSRDKTSGKPTFHDRMLDITPAQLTK